jgi:glycosyltransferase involved in cell wall biosynthesis
VGPREQVDKVNAVNTRSDHLVVLIATCNRLAMLRAAVDAIEAGTKTPHEIVVIDGGSTDGTIDYVQTHPRITPVLQGKLLGTARSYNGVWRHVDSRYSCWLSDDTDVVPGAFDTAVAILDADQTIGMVGLKMKDTKGAGRHEAYRGGLSEYGILNCNHGVVRTDLARQVGFFNEGYRSYMIDPDMTASILCTGHTVVMTREVAVLHHREWAEREGNEKVERDMGGIDNFAIYRRKFAFLEASRTPGARIRARAVHYLARLLFLGARPDARRLMLNRRDWINLAGGRFISLFDPIVCAGRPYNLAQRIPTALLDSAGNPYRDRSTQSAISHQPSAISHKPIAID